MLFVEIHTIVNIILYKVYLMWFYLRVVYEWYIIPLVPISIIKDSIQFQKHGKKTCFFIFLQEIYDNLNIFKHPVKPTK